MKRIYVIDGARFSTLDGFYDEVSRVLIPGCWWGRNLDAFNDILRGGFGTPAEGFVIRWENSQDSRQRLGHMKTENNIDGTVFDELVDIIQDHCEGGKQSDDGVELVLV